MALTDRELDDLLYRWGRADRRYTQDSPVLPDVWRAYAQAPDARHHLLLTPHAPRPASALAAEVRRRVEHGSELRLAYTNTYAVAALTFAELIAAVLPLSRWWQDAFAPEAAIGAEAPSREPQSDHQRWLRALVTRIAGWDDLPRFAVAHEPLLFQVTPEREAYPALKRSVKAIKADAVHRLFVPSCKRLRWAVIDDGIDATHPAFRRRDEHGRPLGDDAFANLPGGLKATRVWRTYDFTRVRDVLAAAMEAPLPPGPSLTADRGRELHDRLRRGQSIDWDLVADALVVPHERDGEHRYVGPPAEHGTHVAGILGGDWPDPGRELIGVCPDIELVDLRVLGGTNRDGEFSVLSALQFVRHLNARSDLRVIHGVNLSFSIKHLVDNFACGRTPVCEEVERLIGSGVVAVAAAGNDGYGKVHDRDGRAYESYRAISITDPGNAHGAITVGSTHAAAPHAYGVSFFSSRGPTGDGRAKPDLVAPGEKITAPIPNEGYKEKDGTSMAAPHVSGAAALLMARHDELIGDPVAIKRILCETATDLGRERYFQGAGMLDVLRAMQAH